MTRWPVVAWAAWNCGSASFNVVITTFVFSVYLTSAVATDENSGSSGLGWSTAAAGVVIALIAPVWGQRSDAAGADRGRQRRLGILTAMVVLVTAALALVRPEPSYLLTGLVLLAAGNIAIELAGVDCNALLRRVAPARAAGRVSGLGIAALNVGGIAVLFLSYNWFIDPVAGWSSGTRTDGAGVRAVAILCAVWLAVFALPVLVTRLPAPAPHGPVVTRPRQDWATSYRHVWRDLKALRHDHPHLLGFLIASALFRDGLAAVFAFSGIVAHGTFGLNPADIILFAIAANVTTAAGAVAGGVLDDRAGPKAVIVGSLIGVVACAIPLLFLAGSSAFWTCGLLVSLFVGPVQSASRSYLVRMAPPEREGELFGLYATTGRAMSFLAPAAFALCVSIFGTQRWGMLGIIAVLVIGLLATIPVRAVDATASADAGNAAPSSPLDQFDDRRSDQSSPPAR